ncbi:MAG: hypothetical protein P8J87_05050 [Verrucomicrobiales bacterium]|nr:hypothetical protein [Verrucomicrobiales bacterium]
MDKETLIGGVLEELQRRHVVLMGGAAEAASGADDEQNKQEGKYDTRAIEASYLAQGQAEKAVELAQAIEAVGALPLKAWGEGDPVALGAVVGVKYPGDVFWYLLVPAGGGVEVEVDGKEITTVTPEAPVGRALLGKRAGGKFEVRAGLVAEVVEVF